MPCLSSFRRHWRARVVACAIAGLCASSIAAQTTPGGEFDRIVAVVNDDIIASSELEARLKRVREQLRQSGTAAPPPDALRRQVLERLILIRLQLQLARDSGIRVGDDRLNKTVLRIAQQNELTLREFRDALERDGYEYAKFREEVRDDIMISEVRRLRVENQINISQRDIDDYLAMMESRGTEADRHQLRIGHILIAVPDGASSEEIEQGRVRTERVLEEIRGGADFANMAVTHSDGQQALEGGDLGWRQASELPTMLADAVLGLEVGEVSEPVRSPSGFHLVNLVAKRGSERQMIRQTHARHILIALDELTEFKGLDASKVESALLALPFADLARHGIAVLFCECFGPQIRRFHHVRIGRDQPFAWHLNPPLKVWFADEPRDLVASEDPFEVVIYEMVDRFLDF